MTSRHLACKTPLFVERCFRTDHVTHSGIDGTSEFRFLRHRSTLEQTLDCYCSSEEHKNINTADGQQNSVMRENKMSLLTMVRLLLQAFREFATMIRRELRTRTLISSDRDSLSSFWSP